MQDLQMDEVLSSQTYDHVNTTIKSWRGDLGTSRKLCI